MGLVGSIKENFNRLISRYAPWIKRIPLEQGLRFEPTWKALPTHSLTKRVWVERRKLPYRKIRNFRSSFTSFSHELGAFQWLLVVGHSQGTQWSHGCLWPPRIRYAFDVRNKTFTPEDFDSFERRIGPFLPSCDDMGRNHRQTRLHVWGCWQASYIRNRKLCESEVADWILHIRSNPSLLSAFYAPLRGPLWDIRFMPPCFLSVGQQPTTSLYSQNTSPTGLTEFSLSGGNHFFSMPWYFLFCRALLWSLVWWLYVLKIRYIPFCFSS